MIVFWLWVLAGIAVGVVIVFILIEGVEDWRSTRETHDE